MLFSCFAQSTITLTSGIAQELTDEVTKQIN